MLPKGVDLDDLVEDNCQDIALTLNPTLRKCLDYKTQIETFLTELGIGVTIRFV